VKVTTELAAEAAFLLSSISVFPPSIPSSNRFMSYRPAYQFGCSSSGIARGGLGNFENEIREFLMAELQQVA